MNLKYHDKYHDQAISKVRSITTPNHLIKVPLLYLGVIYYCELLFALSHKFKSSSNSFDQQQMKVTTFFPRHHPRIEYFIKFATKLYFLCARKII